MRRFKLQFISKFHLAFAALLLVTVAFAWIFNFSSNVYRQSVERSALVDYVLQSYQELSNRTFRELSTLSNVVLLGDSSDLPDQRAVAVALRQTISILRHDIAAELSSMGIGDAAEQMERVAEIDRLVEEFIRTSVLVEQSMNEGRVTDARNELELLRNSGFTDEFNTLIRIAMADLKAESQKVNQRSTALTVDVANFLPMVMTLMVIITLFLIFVLSRRLTRSVNALHEGAQAFRSGDLSYRIPDLSEKEFRRLADAFNTMALQLSEHREQLRNTNVQLETTVDERTRALQESNKKLAVADVNRRKLLANISHEFRTPLTVIRGEAEIAVRGSEKTVADLQESFRRIVDQADNATRLVNDLLFIARVEAGEPRLKSRPVTITDMIEAICVEFAAKANAKGVEIERRRMAVGSVVQGDPGRLRQVFAILIENALRYSDPGNRIEIWVEQGNGNVEIIFKDEGIGLTEEESKLAFERFYRSPSAIEKSSGTGLGLAVAKAIVEAHNGTISLSGKPGEGATATVVLPIGREFGVVE